MPKAKLTKKKTKTYDGCWSCRERGIKCDEAKPGCANCLKNSIPCKGYDIRLSWDTKKTDNLRRFKVYNHFEKSYFYIEDLNAMIQEIDELIESSSYRNLVRLPFTVFESNSLIQYWIESIVDNYHLQWFKKFMLQNLSNQNVMNSIYASTSYFMRKFDKGDYYKLQIWQDLQNELEFHDLEKLCWVYSAINIMLTSDFVSLQRFDYLDTMDNIERLLSHFKAQDSVEYNQILSFLSFIESLKFIKPQNPIHSASLEDLGLTSNLLHNWHQILSISSNKNLSFFKLENELWFNKMKLVLPVHDKRHHKSYIWYISMYIYFIKKFYHRHHGTVSINYLINEAIPHLKQIDYNQDFFGLRWCLFIISNESNNPKCNEILSIHLPKLHIPNLTDPDQDWIQYIENSNTLLI